MADQLALALDAAATGTYRPRGTSSLQRLFRAHLPQLLGRYDAEFAVQIGTHQKERIASAVERFLDCGDYTKGLARIQCTNPGCKADYLRPFSCKVLHLCPSCSQKRTLLFGEYMNERLLLRLPHRQVVFTFPKVLRVFFRHAHGLAGAAVIACASAGDFVRCNPHLHAIFLEGGFDRQGRFVHLPSLDLQRLAQYFRASIVAFFLRRSLINERLAKSMLGWTHSGFSLDMSVRILWPAAGRSPAGGPAGCSRTREALAHYIARPPVSLGKMLVEEHGGSVLYRSEYNPYFKTDCRLFPALEFLVQLLQHLPDPRTHLVRLAPQGWLEQHPQQPPPPVRAALQESVQPSISARESRSAWARLLAKVDEVDVTGGSGAQPRGSPLRCSHCGSAMKVLAVITDPSELRRILLHLIKTGVAPPGLEASALN